MARRLSLAMLVLTYALITLGGFVHNTESSLACPDWPLCFGQVLPAMEGGVAIEHSHRLLATLVGLLTIVLVIALHRDPAARRWRAWGWAALALVIGQGVLGGITVLLKLPTLVSTLHLATSMAFFGTLVALAFRLHRPAPSPIQGHALAGVGWGVALVYLQILLGALVRHTGSGAAVGLGPQSVVVGFDLARAQRDLWPADGPGRLHMLHRFLAAGVLVYVCILAGRLWPAARRVGDRVTQTLTASLLALVVVQIGLGMASIWTFRSVPLVTAHLAGGAALWANVLVLWLWLAPRAEKVDTVPSSARSDSVTSDLRLAGEGGP
jgi:heme A synthase